jgi:hypothetical protein
MKQTVSRYVEKLKESSVYKLARQHPRRAEFIAVSLFFGALAALFMGPILFHFASAVHGFWGDGTGGLIWFNSLDKAPFGGPTNDIVYPYGDNLFRPDMITAAMWVVPYWIIAKVVGGVAAWNLIILVSFWLCGVSMYYLVKRLAGNRKAALWAGVAFAYMPMHQYKAFGHIAYVLTFVFVFVFWHVLNFMQKPTKKNAVRLGLAFSIPFYIDGYYVLFSLILVGVPLAYLVVRWVWRLNKKTVDEFKSFVVATSVFVATSLVMLIPIIACKILYGAQISAGLALARGDFMSNVIVYTARWYDFIIPIETHPVFGSWATAFRTGHNHGSNTSEHTLYIGFIVLGLAAWTAYYFWKRRTDTALKKTTPVKPETVLLILLVTFIAFLITLPPYFHLFGHRIPMPSGVISVLAQYWRVYARLILIIQMLLVVVAAFGLAILLGRVRRRAAAWGLVAALIVLTFFEYLSFNPFHRQDIWYYDKLSSSTRWLAQQDDIKVIAVYPLVDQPDGLAALYTTEQPVHGKKMINSGTITTKGARLRASISGLNDPQTVAVLKALGAQAVMTHEIGNDRSVSGLKFAYGANEAPAGYAADVDVFRIADTVAPVQYALIADTGFKDMRMVDLTTRHYLNNSGIAELRIERMPGITENPDATRQVTFTLQTTDTYAGNDLVVMQDNKVLDTLHLAAGQQATYTYEMREGSTLRIVAAGQLKDDSVYIGKLSAQ